ncbi:MAG: hypothetical protein IBX72_11255 [Nitrospirae bacterium]|nr:hypothetical protein [Nitrospirota bacterium]
MKLPNIRNINIRGVIAALTDKKRKLLFVLVPVVVVVVGFSLGGVVYTLLKGEGKDVQLSRPDAKSVAKGYPGESTVASKDIRAKEDTTGAVSVPESTAQHTESDETSARLQTTADGYQTVAGKANVYNPFEFSYDGKHAEEKSVLIKELELEEIKARIREAQQKGKKETQGISSRMTLPPLDAFQKKQTSGKDLQSSLPALESPKKEKEAAPARKVRIPGYIGVMIDSSRKAVVLDDGNVYEAGSHVSEGLYVDKILSGNDIFLKDVFGNVFKLKPSAYEVTLYTPQ